MEAEKLGRRLAAEYPDRIEWTARSDTRLYAIVPPELFDGAVTFLLEQFSGRLRHGTSSGIDLRDGIGVFHHFVINGESLVVTLKLIAPKPDPRLPSLARRLPSARWIEREMAEMLGIVFEGHPDPRRLLKAEAFPDTLPLRRDFDPRAFKEKIGELPEF